MALRILLLTQWFDPEPTFKGLLFAKALKEKGHEVHVITGFPNYPGGKLYPGYKIQLYKREKIDDVTISRVFLYPSHDKSAIGRVLNYVTFAISASIAGVFSRFRADVIYVYHPPLTVGIAAVFIGSIRRIPFVYDVQDLWPDTLEATGMIRSHRVLGVVSRIATWVYKRAEIVIAQSPGFFGRLLSRGIPTAKLRLIYNWCDEPALQARSPIVSFDLGSLDGYFKLVFAGNMGKAQSLRSVLEAAEIVQNSAPWVRFVFVGGGTEVEDLKSHALARKLVNTVFVPRMPMNEVGNILDRADALLVHLNNSQLFEITLPSKTQAYLFAGKPILMAVAGDAASLISRAQAGVLAKPEDPQSIASAVLKLASLPTEERIKMGERGRSFYKQYLSLDTGTDSMVNCFNEAISMRHSWL